MIKYIGSKRKLLPQIVSAVQSLQGSGSVIDLFSGTSRVGHALKGAGYKVIANDHNAYAACIARCYVQSDIEEVRKAAEKLLKEFASLPGKPGYFTDTFCVQSRYFQPKNGERVDAIRDAIAAKSLDPELESVVLVSLMEAADRVDSTTGVQMAYLKSWAARAFNDLELRLPDVLPQAAAGKSEAHHMDAMEAATKLSGDIAYLDPPYNQHKYLGNYHIWESLVTWDKPAFYGIACKREDCRTRSSVFNSKPRFSDAIRHVVRSLDVKWFVVSFNNEGYLDREEMESILRERGEVLVLEHDYKRYVGAQIGIYNPKGDKVGAVSHLRNTEYLYVVGDPSKLKALESQSKRAEPQLQLFG